MPTTEGTRTIYLDSTLHYDAVNYNPVCWGGGGGIIPMLRTRMHAKHISFLTKSTSAPKWPYPEKPLSPNCRVIALTCYKHTSDIQRHGPVTRCMGHREEDKERTYGCGSFGVCAGVPTTEGTRT